MACRPCARRRKALEAKRQQKEAEEKMAQAAAIGAVLTVTEVAGKMLGITGEADDGQGSDSGTEQNG